MPDFSLVQAINAGTTIKLNSSPIGEYNERTYFTGF